MPRPVIGITLDNAGNTAASGRYEVGSGYSRAVAAAGGLPVLLPHEADAGAVAGYAELCDGFIFTGGVDPDTAALPADWPGHGPLHPAARRMDPTRQAFEFALLAEVERAKPGAAVLGVCLGMQLMALAAGGALHQYLPGSHPPEVAERHRDGDHRLEVPAGGGALPGGVGVVHSHHQQAVADAGRLRVVATAEDGIVEAVDDPARRFYLGVQWHPERGDGGALSRGLIGRMVAAAKP